MWYIWTSTLKDLRRLRRDPFLLAAALGIPFVQTLLVSLMFGGGDPVPQGRLLLVDEDRSLLSTLLPGAFSQGPLGKMLFVETVAWEDGRRRMDQGAASALLFLPKGFQQAVLRDEPCELRLVINPSERILPGMVREALSVLTEAEFYAQLLVGDQLRRFAHGRPSERDVAEASVAFSRLGEKLGRYLDPLLIELKTEVDEPQEKPKGGVGGLFFPGMLFMALMILSQGLAGDLWTEKASGILRRTAITPGQLAPFLAGKVLSAGLVFLAVGAMGLAGARGLLDLPLANPLAAVLWVPTAGMAIFLLVLLGFLYASSARGGNVLTSLGVFLFGLVGGTFFPFEMMPDWLAAVGRLTPNGWAIVQFKAFLAGSAEPAGLALTFAGLTAVGTLGFLLALRRLRGHFLF